MGKTHRIADMLERIAYKLIGFQCGKRSVRLVPYLHSCRERGIVTGRCRTSYDFQQRGGPEFVPVGEEIVVYLWRGYVYTFWKGDCIGIDFNCPAGRVLAYGTREAYYRCKE